MKHRVRGLAFLPVRLVAMLWTRFLGFNLGSLPAPLKFLFLRLLAQKLGFWQRGEDDGWEHAMSRRQRRSLYFRLPKAARRTYLAIYGAQGLPVPAGGATIVGSRSGLFWATVPGGLPIIQDVKYISGNVFFVDNSAPAAQRADTAGYGKHPDKPFSTIDFAVGQCTATQGDAIFVLPGHSETLTAAAGIDLDVAGISVVGLGRGTARPTIAMSTSTLPRRAPRSARR